jgi:hypothetical protein
MNCRRVRRTASQQDGRGKDVLCTPTLSKFDL